MSVTLTTQVHEVTLTSTRSDATFVVQIGGTIATPGGGAANLADTWATIATGGALDVDTITLGARVLAGADVVDAAEGSVLVTGGTVSGSAADGPGVYALVDDVPTKVGDVVAGSTIAIVGATWENPTFTAGRWVGQVDADGVVHVIPVPDTAPSDDDPTAVAQAADPGTSTDYARADHVHTADGADVTVVPNPGALGLLPDALVVTAQLGELERLIDDQRIVAGVATTEVDLTGLTDIENPPVSQPTLEQGEVIPGRQVLLTAQTDEADNRMWNVDAITGVWSAEPYPPGGLTYRWGGFRCIVDADGLDGDGAEWTWLPDIVDPQGEAIRRGDTCGAPTWNDPGTGRWVQMLAATTGGGTGDVVGPASATNGHVALFDGATGKLLKDGGALGTAAFSATGDFAAAGHNHDGTYAAAGHNHSGTYVALATVDAKGDLLAGTADNTAARLAVGTDGYGLVADSAQTSGLAWKRVHAVGGSGTFKRISDSVRDYRIPGFAAITGSTTSSPSVNRTYFEPYLLTETQSFDRVAIEVTTAAAAGKLFRIGLYTADAYWQPSALVLDAGTVAADPGSVPTLQVITLGSTLTLTPGRYVGVWVTDGSPVVRAILCFAGVSNALRAAGNVSPIRGLGATSGSSTGALPDPATSTYKMDVDSYTTSGAPPYALRWREVA